MRRPFRIFSFFILVSFILTPGLSVAGQDAYQQTAWVVAGGGSSLAAGPYTLTSTLGQPEAGSSFSGGEYVLQGGFWAANPPNPRHIYLPYLGK